MTFASIGSNRPPTSSPRVDPGVHPDAVAGRPAQRLDAAGRRQEPVLRVLGVQPDLDRMTGRRHVGLANPSGSPAAIRSWSSTRSRPVTSSVTGCSTWSRVFISRKTGSPRSSTRNSHVPAPTYPTAPASVSAASPSRPRSAGIDGRRRRLLEHLLVPPLDRAIALAEVDAVAVGVEQDLDLDVARPFEEALEDQPVVAECRGRLATAPPRAHRPADPCRARSACPCRRHRPPA